MIYNFEVKNFSSINEKQILNFTINNQIDNSSVNTKFGIVNKINAILGANASGKTNILQALCFFCWFAEHSFNGISQDTYLPFSRHKLHMNKPCEMQMTFGKDNYLFKLKFILNEEKLLYEKLSIKTAPNAQFKQVYLLDRRYSPVKTLYSEYVKRLSREERERILQKQNSSLFSYYIITGFFKNICMQGIFSKFITNLTNAGPMDTNLTNTCIHLSKKILSLKENSQDILCKILESVDLGINKISNKVTYIIYDNQKVPIVNFIHGKGKNYFELSMFEESMGTIQALAFLLNYISVIKNGGIIIADEIEQSIHPNIIKQFIAMLSNPELNTMNAQIIFSTHQPLLIDKRNKSQIFLTEKLDGINTEIYRLDSVKGVRNSDNFVLKYLSGIYGGVPRGRVTFWDANV